MEIIDLGKYRCRGGGDGGCAGDAKFRWLHGNDCDEYNDDYCQSDEDFFQHSDFLRIGFRSLAFNGDATIL